MASYNEILSSMEQTYQNYTGFYPENATDIKIRLMTVAKELSDLCSELEQFKADAFPQTSSGEALDLHASTRGITRKPAIAAAGKLKFSRSSTTAMDLVIPAGIICSTNGDPVTRFETIEAGTLSKNSLEVQINAKAIQPGQTGNAAPNTINVMVTPPIGITAVTNPTAFIGGMDAEDDSSLRQRLIQSFSNISNGTNKAFYYDEAMKWDGIASANIVAATTANGTVEVVVTGYATNPSADTLARLSAHLQKLREINVVVNVLAATEKSINITMQIAPKEGFNFENLVQVCTKKIQNYINDLGVGKDLILTALGNTVYDIDGVYNYKFTAPTTDIYLSDKEVARVGTITITRLAVV